MKKIMGLIKITRPFTSFTGAISTFIGCYLAGIGNWEIVIFSCLTTFFVSASSIAWNDLMDVEIDKINQPQRAIPSGEVSAKSARNLAFMLTVIALLLASFINIYALLMTLFVSILLYIYSWKLKSTILIGNLTTASIAASSMIFGGVSMSNIKPTLLPAFVILCAISGREVLKAIADYEGDLKEHCKTVATMWGQTTARKIYVFIAISTIIAMMLPYLLGGYNLLYVILTISFVYPVIIYITIRVVKKDRGKQLEKLSLFAKYYIMPIWFLAVYLGVSVNV